MRRFASYHQVVMETLPSTRNAGRTPNVASEKLAPLRMGEYRRDARRYNRKIHVAANDILALCSDGAGSAEVTFQNFRRRGNTEKRRETGDDSALCHGYDGRRRYMAKATMPQGVAKTVTYSHR